MLNKLFDLVGLSSYKMVLIVRSDLRMKTGKIATQCAHASVELYKKAAGSKGNQLKLWLLIGQPKIVLRVNSLEELKELYEAANDKNLITSLVHDAGRTQVKEGTLTVLGIGPDNAQDIDSVTKHLKLL